MIRATRVAVVVASLGLVAVACASFSSGDTASVDGGPDATAIDAMPIDGAPQPFCTLDSGATYCEDFDDPSRTWYAGFSITDGGSLVVVDDASVSPPSSLHATAFGLPDAGAWAFAIVDVLQPMTNGFHFETKVFPGAFTSEVQFGFALFTNAPQGSVDGGACAFYMKTSADESKLETAPPDASSTAATLGYHVVAGRWNAIAIDLAGAMLTVTIDGKPAGAIPLAPACQGATYFDGLWIGIPNLGRDYPGAVETWIDDVRIDVH